MEVCSLICVCYLQRLTNSESIRMEGRDKSMAGASAVYSVRYYGKFASLNSTLGFSVSLRNNSDQQVNIGILINNT